MTGLDILALGIVCFTILMIVTMITTKKN